jgi:hypothetical protein
MIGFLALLGGTAVHAAGGDPEAGAAKSAQPAAKASAGDGGVAVNVDGDVSGNLIIGNNNKVGTSK